MGDQKHSLILVGPKQGQRPSVFFYTIYKSLKQYTYTQVLYTENRKIIYCAHTGVDSSMSTWAMHHADTPTTLLELSSPIQSWWSESIISSYATSIISRPQRSVVLRNHHRILMTNHHHKIIVYIYICVSTHSHLVASSSYKVIE